MDKELDDELYNNYLNGEKEAFEILYNKYKKRIEYFIYNIIKDYQKAEDLTQETFIYVMQNKIKENCSFKYYIYLKAKGIALNFIKVENTRNEIREKYLNKETQIEKDVLDVILKEETKKELIESIDLLDEKYKNAMYLVCIEEMSYEETARILGETIQNIKNLVHRGKKQLRNILIKKEFNEMNKAVKVLLIIFIATTFIGGFVYAATTIYNEYTKNLKNAGEIKSDELYRDYEGNYTYENKDNMQYDEETGFSYIIINNILDFTKYKEKLEELPEMKESDFEKHSLIIIVKYDWFNAYESNLKIYDITSDETTTYIELTQNENLNYNKESITLYAVIDNSFIKNNIELNIEKPDVQIENFVSIENLPNNYSVEDAINDGCFVTVNYKVLSENKTALDELIECEQTGEEKSMRIYNKLSKIHEDDTSWIEKSEVIDVKYKNGIYLFNVRKLNNDRIYTIATTKINKNYYYNKNIYFYEFSDEWNVPILNETGNDIFEFSKNMRYDEVTDLYYKVITNIDDLNKCKEVVNDFPKSFEIDFNKSCLIVVGNYYKDMPHKRDLQIANINVDETTTYVELKQNEKADYTKEKLIIYKIFDKELLKDNVKLNFEEVNMQISGMINLGEVPSDYSVEEAISDGCLVKVVKMSDNQPISEILSSNRNAINEYIDKAEKGIESMLRVYLKEFNDVTIIDMKYENGIYIWNSRELSDSNIYTCSSKNIEKIDEGENLCEYILKDAKELTLQNKRYNKIGIWNIYI